MKHRLLPFLLGLLLVLTGCAGQNFNLTKMLKLDRDPNAPPFTEVIPERLPLKESDLPADARLVIATLAAQAYQEPGLPREIAFAPDGRHELYDPNFDYSGFLLHHIEIISYDARPLGLTTEVRLGGIFHFEDIIGRRASTRYFARYTPSKTGILILESDLRPVQPAFPEVQCFFIQEAKFKRLQRGLLDSYLTWYLFAVDSAENLTPSAAEIEARRAYQNLSLFDKIKQAPQRVQDKYLIVLFAKDRIVDNGKLAISFANFANGNTTEPNHKDVTIIDENGWKFAVVGAEFAIDAWSNNFFVNVTYAPDSVSYKTKGYPVQVASFTNQKNYPKEPGQARTTATGPLESGQQLLDPASRSDARRIQGRLADLGFYASAIDGLFGQGSRASLRQFRLNRGLGDSSEWDMTTQKALFAGSGE